MKKILSALDKHIEEYCMVVLLAVMSVVIFAQVVSRYVFSNSISWSEEIARYIFVWVVYFAISYGVKVNAHVKVDAFITFMPNFMAKPIRIISNFLFLVFCGLMMVYGVKVVDFILASKQSSPALGMPMGLVYLAVPVGFTLTAIRLVQDTIAKLKGKGE